MAVAVFLAFAAVALLLASVFYFASAICAILLVLTCARDKIEEQETFPEFLERFRANVEKEIIDPPSKQAEDFEELFESGNGYCVPGGFFHKGAALFAKPRLWLAILLPVYFAIIAKVHFPLSLAFTHFRISFWFRFLRCLVLESYVGSTFSATSSKTFLRFSSCSTL